jgi:hypothetical protein
MSLSTRLLAGTGALVMAAGAMVFAQSTDVSRVMADMRKALGGDEKLAAVKSLAATGKSQRATGETSMGGDYEMMLELPDKYFTRQVMAQTPVGPVGIKAGFNGDGLIQETEQPPQMAGMRMMVSTGGSGLNATPEARAAAATRQIASSKEELARMALGMFGGSVGGYALEYAYGGTAESPDGKADIIDVKGQGDFAGKLFVDQKSHLPLMFSWMAKEPMQLTQSVRPGSPGGTSSGGNVQTFTMGGGGGGKPMTAEEVEKMKADLDARMKEAEANRKMVEYRMFYSDYQSVDGLQLPHHFQQAIAGNPSTEITIEKYRVNPKIDPKKFETVK